MKFSDEVLMAYADGELDAAQRGAIEQAMREDPAVADAVARHQALRRDVFDAFAGVLDEPVPARLASRPATVVPLQQAREERNECRERREATRRWSWPEWGALAASLALGVVAGGAGWQSLQGGTVATLAQADGKLVAHGRLADALTRQLASAPQGDVRIGVSFVDRDGAYCRSFTLDGSAGLACRSGDGWRIPILTENAAAAGTQYRQAGAQLPPAVLDAIDERIAGTTLDARGEEAARARGWRR